MKISVKMGDRDHHMYDFRTLTPVLMFFKVKKLYSSENIQYCIFFGSVFIALGFHLRNAQLVSLVNLR